MYFKNVDNIIKIRISLFGLIKNVYWNKRIRIKEKRTIEKHKEGRKGKEKKRQKGN